MKVYKRFDDLGRRDFVRLDCSWIGIGIHLRYGNYIKGKGWELFTVSYRRTPRLLRPFLNWSIGWVRKSGVWEWRGRFLHWRWSGSGIRPHTALTIRIGRFGISCHHVPLWIEKWADARVEKYWAKYYAGMEEEA